MNFHDYTQIDAINQSKLKVLGLKSPAHFKAALDAGDNDTDGRALGRYLHALVLEPDSIEAEFVFWESGRRAGKAWEQFKADAGTRTIVNESTAASARDVQYVRDAAEAVRAHPFVAAQLANARTEVTFTGADTVTGRGIKCRADLVTPELWLDLKGVDSTLNRAFGSIAYRNGWVHQAAFNRRCILAAGETPPEQYGFIVAELKPPHDVAVYLLPTDVLEFADAEVTEWLETLIECERNDVWPGRQPSGEPELLDIPSYAFGGTDPDIIIED